MRLSRSQGPQLYFGETDRAACYVRAESSEASRDTMTTSNVSRLHEYLQAVASMGPYETVADFYTADVTFQSFPNRIAPMDAFAASATLEQRTNRADRFLCRKLIESNAF